MKIALLQTKPVVGDFKGNAAQILDQAMKAKKAGCQLAVTPELAIVGYPPRDLLLYPGVIDQCTQWTEWLAKELKGQIPLLLGGVLKNPSSEGRPLFNAALFIDGGEIKAQFRKSLLPTYDVFDEDRYFEPGQDSTLLDIKPAKIGVTVCEDIWNDRDIFKRRRYHKDPVEQLTLLGADCVINLSASPFFAGKQQFREKMLGSMARKYKVPLLYVNQVGGNDDLIFDGSSSAFDRNGLLMARAKAFAEDTLIVDLEKPKGTLADYPTETPAQIWNALVLGTHDYAERCGFKGALLGLSGGIDSAITAAIAVEALGAKNVLGVLMPSPYSSQGSLDDALELARNLGIKTFTIPIEDLMKSFKKALAQPFSGMKEDVTEENIQARIRGNLMMAMSNKFHSLLLTTGNKSELSVGYCTLYGDMSGGLAVISDVPKTQIYQLSRWLNQKRAVIPINSIEKAPSAELRPNQTDQDSLPPYDVLDDILRWHIEEHQTAKEIIARGFDEATVTKVLRLVEIAEFKRKQAAPGLKVTDRAFGTGWRMPIAKAAWASSKNS